MAEITVSPTGQNGSFSVKVKDGASSKDFTVTVPENLYQKLGSEKGDREELIRASFLFLLDREPLSSILSSFDLTVIGRYFPEYEDKVGNYF